MEQQVVEDVSGDFGEQELSKMAEISIQEGTESAVLLRWF